MKQTLIIITLFLTTSIAFTACGTKESNTEQTEQTAEYTCPMHPEVKATSRVNALNAEWN